MTQLVILDFDGTLADTQPIIIASIQATLRELGLPMRTDEECKSIIGLPLAECFERLLTPSPLRGTPPSEGGEPCRRPSTFLCEGEASCGFPNSSPCEGGEPCRRPSTFLCEGEASCGSPSFSPCEGEASCGSPSSSPCEGKAFCGFPNSSTCEGEASCDFSNSSPCQGEVPEGRRGIAERCADVYRRVFDELNTDGTVRLFPHVLETITALHDRGLQLAICSSRGRPTLEGFVKTFRLEHYVSMVVSANDVERHKPHPEPVQKILAALGVAPGEAVVVGDASYDILMGRAAGCRTVGVTYGNQSAADLRAAGADHLIDDFADLLTLPVDSLPC